MANASAGGGIGSAYMLAVFAACFGEGALAAVGVRSTTTSGSALVLSALGAAGGAATLLAPLALCAWFIFSRPEVRHLGQSLREGLGGKDVQTQRLAVLAWAGLLALTATHVAMSGRGFIATRGAGIAATLIVASALGSVALSALLVTTVVQRVGPWVGRYVTCSAPMERLGLAAIVAVGVHQLVPAAYAVMLDAAVLGFFVGLLPPVELRMARWFHARRAAMALAAMAVVGPFASLVLLSLPSAAQLTVLYRAPYVSLVIETMRAMTDRDKDGYSGLLGADCNDADKRIHPGAFDVPGNGVDENCSGEDASEDASPLLASLPPSSKDVAAPLSVVLVHLDALRPDHLGFAGYTRPTSPNLDRFRASATWFNRAYTPSPSTRFAMASLFTGLAADRIPHQQREVDISSLPSVTTVAERLEPLRYDRVGFTISHAFANFHGMGRGFRVWTTPWPVEQGDEVHGHDATLTTDAALTYLDGARPEDRYFLFLHYYCMHEPYIAHPAWNFGQRDVDRYDSALGYCDQEVGRVLSRLSERPDWDRTAVIFYSDHGELFGEHGFVGHGNSLSESDTRVLLMARIPGGAVSTVSAPVSLTDLAPTILALAKAPSDGKTDGWNLVPFVFGSEDAGERERPLFFYAEHRWGVMRIESRGVLRGSYKYLQTDSGLEQLYSLDVDPGERENLALASHSTRDGFVRLLDSWQARTWEKKPSL